VRAYLQIVLAQRDHEISWCFFSIHRIAPSRPREMFRGTLTQTCVYPREVVKRALSLIAAAVILAHNHPSGVAEPSRADEFLTQSLRSALALVVVTVLDHIVVAGCKTTSLPIAVCCMSPNCTSSVVLPVRIGIFRSGFSPPRDVHPRATGGRP